MKITRDELDKMLDTLAKSLSISTPDKSTKDIYFQTLSKYDNDVIMKSLIVIASSYKPRRLSDFPVLAEILDHISIADPKPFEDKDFWCDDCRNTGYVYKDSQKSARPVVFRCHCPYGKTRRETGIPHA